MIMKQRCSDMRKIKTITGPFALLLVGGIAIGFVGAWTPAPARSAVAPGGPPPALASAAPSPSPKAHGAVIQAPMIKLPHVYVNEGSYLVDKTYIGGPLDCGTTPAKWATGAASNLKAGYSDEKAYFQQKDRFDTPALIGYVPETIYRACINFVVNVGHYAGDQPASVFFITARHNAGGPMYCVSSISGTTLAAGNVGVSNAGGPILSSDQCGALPVWVPALHVAPEMMRPAMPLPVPTSSSSAGH
jgi:hypothetical protein